MWVFPATYLPRRLSAKIRARDPAPPPSVGLRRVVGRACAASSRSRPPWRSRSTVPERDLIIFLTFCVILATLVGQGLTLPWVIHRLGVVAGTSADREEAVARQAAVEAALLRLDGLADEFPDHQPLVDQLRERYDHEASHATNGAADVADEADQELLDHQAIRQSIVAAQREAVIRLRDDGAIGDEALHRVERDLDLEAVRTGV